MSNWLILGGCGFIGRNLVEHLKNTGAAKKIRVADKLMPALAGLSKAQAEIFESDLVDYKQANLANPSTTKSFTLPFSHFLFILICLVWLFKNTFILC